jgi:hypothetical protein
MRGTTMIACMMLIFVPPSTWAVEAVDAQADAVDAQSVPSLDTLLEAGFRAASDRLVSGKMTGTFQFFERRGPGEEWKLKDDAKVTIHFDRPRYNVDLDYQTSHQRSKRRVIVYDTTAIMTSHFSDAISKTGCQAEVFAARKAGPGIAVKPTVAGFPWDISQSAATVVNPIKVFLSHPDYRQKLSRNDAGDIILHLDEKGSTIDTVFAKLYGLNPTSMTVQVDGRPEPTQVRSAKWKFTDGLWHVSALTSIFVPANLNEALATRSELELTDFEINPEVDPEHFTIGALDLPGGTRILDHRPDIDDERRVLYNPLQDKELSSHLDRIADQLKQLPSRSIRPPLVQTAHPGRLWLIVFNVIVVLILGLLALTGRRAKAD